MKLGPVSLVLERKFTGASNLPNAKLLLSNQNELAKNSPIHNREMILKEKIPSLALPSWKNREYEAPLAAGGKKSGPVGFFHLLLVLVR